MAAAVVAVLPRFRFDDSPFIAGHGRSPRGVGCWAFGCCQHQLLSVAGSLPLVGFEQVFFSPPLRLAAAKSWAADAAAAAGVPAGSVLFVLP